MGAMEYVYELRRGDEIVATGRLSREERLDVGDRVEISHQEGIVRRVDPLLGEAAMRLVVQLVRADNEPKN
jgi:hypothetical protein